MANEPPLTDEQLAELDALILKLDSFGAITYARDIVGSLKDAIEIRSIRIAKLKAEFPGQIPEDFGSHYS